jgi:hypothetical protein
MARDLFAEMEKSRAEPRDLFAERKIATEPKKEPATRNPLAVLNDTVIGVANAAAAGAKSAADFVSPGSSFSKAVDEFIKQGEESQSDIVKAAREKYSKDMANAKSMMEEAAITAKYIKDNPLQSAATAAGSFAGPGLAIKGATKASQLLKVTDKVAGRLGLGTGIVTNAAMSGGDAGGSAYEMVMQTPDAVLMENEFIRSQVEAGRSLEDVKKEAATTAARRASVVPALIGGVTGAFGMERVLAGMGGKTAKSVFGTAVKSGLSEAFQEAIEEGATEYSGRAAAQEYDPSIDPMKGVAGAATMGAALGAIPGAGIGVLDARRQLAEQAAQKEAAAQQASQNAEQAAAAIVPQAQQVQAQAEQAATPPQALQLGIVDPNQIQDVLDQAGPIAEEIDQDAALAAKAEEGKPTVTPLPKKENETPEYSLARYKSELAAGVDATGKKIAFSHRKNIQGLIKKLEAEGVNAEQPSESDIEGDQSGAPSAAPTVGEAARGAETLDNSGVVTAGRTTESITRAEGDQRNALEAQQAAEQEAIAAEQQATLEAQQAALMNEQINALNAKKLTDELNAKRIADEEAALAASQVTAAAQKKEKPSVAKTTKAIEAKEEGQEAPQPAAPAVNVKGFKKEHMPYVQAEVGTRAAEPKNMKEAQQYAAAESAFDKFDVAEAVLNKQFKEEIAARNKAANDEFRKNQKLGLPVEAPNKIELHDILTEMTVEDRIKTIEAASKLGELDTNKRKNQKNTRDQFIKSLSEKEQKAIEAKTEKILHQEIKSLSKLGKKTASQVRKERTKASTDTSVATAKKGESKPVEAVKVEKKTDSENIIDRQTVESLKTGNTDEILRTIEKGYTDPATKAFATRIKAVVSQFGIQPKIVIGKVEGNRPGSYDGETDTITIDPDAPRGVQLDVVVLHEYGHFLTDRIIDNPENLTPSQKIALDNLKKLHTYVKSKLGKQYEIGTLKEFVAQSFTNSEFAVAMGNLPPQSTVLKVENALKEFATRVMQLLGFKSGDSTLSQTLENIQTILTGSYKGGAKTPGKAKGVSYMGEPKKAEEPKDRTYKELLEAQRIPEAPKSMVESVRNMSFSKKFFKRLVTLAQNEKYEMKDLQRDISRAGLLIVGDENSFNNLYDASTNAAGKYKNIVYTSVNPIEAQINESILQLMKESKKSYDEVLKELSLYGIARRESRVRKAKFNREMIKHLRSDIKSVNFHGKKMSPAEAAAIIQEEIVSKTSLKNRAKEYGMTQEALAYEYGKFIDKIVSIDTNIDPKVTKEERNPDYYKYNVVGSMTASEREIVLKELNESKHKSLIDKVFKDLDKLNKKTIELNKEANYWSPQVSNLVAYYGGDKDYVPFKGKPLINEKDKMLFAGEYFGKEFQEAPYTQEGRISMPDNPILQMFAEAHLAAARVGRKDVSAALYHMCEPNDYNKNGQGLINGKVTDIITFEDKYTYHESQKIKKLANRENVFFHYMDNGDIAIITLKDDALRDAIRKTYRQSSIVIDRLNAITNRIGQGHTRYNVAFAPKNFITDALANVYNIGADYSAATAGRYLSAIGSSVYANGLIKSGKVAAAFKAGGANPADNPRMKALIDADKSGFTKILAEYLEYGGDISYISSLTTKGQLKDFTKKNMQGKTGAALDNINGYFDTWSAMFEFTSRASAYQILKAEEVGRLLKKGIPLEKAEKYAIEPAVAATKNLANFEEVGKLGKQLGALYMFFRQAATGAVRVIESFAPALSSMYGGTQAAAERAWENNVPKNIKEAAGEKGKKEYIANIKKQAERGRVMATAAMSLGSALYLMSYFTAGDDDKGRNRVGTDDMARWARNARFFVGDGPHDIINIQWGYGGGALASAAAQLTALGMSNVSVYETMSNVIPILMDSFLPLPVSRGNIIESPAKYVVDTIAPSFARPLVEFVMNQNSLGQEIYNDRNNQVGSVYTGGDNIPQIYKFMAETIYETSGFETYISPNVLYFLTNSYIDGQSKFAETAFNLGIVAGGQKDFDLKTDSLVLSGMIGSKSNYDARKWAAVEKDMDRRRARLKEIEDTNNPELYFEYLDNHPLDKMLVNMYNGDAGGKLKSLTEKEQKVRRDRSLDYRTQKELIEVYKMQKDLIKMQLVNLYTELDVGV